MIANDPNSPSEWTQVGWGIGNTDGYVSSSPYIYTETENTTYYTTNSNGIDFHEYGPPGQADEGYWTYYDGYYFNPAKYGGSYNGNEYEYEYDYGSYGNHTPNTGFLTISNGDAWATQEVDQNDTSVSCESANAYFGTDSSGTPSTTYQLVLETTSAVWSQWNSTVSTSLRSWSPYTWSELKNYWSAHSY